MDELPVPLVRSDGSWVYVNAMLGTSATVLCDEGKPPYVLIDAGPVQVLVEPGALDTKTVDVAKQLTVAVQRFEALFSGKNR